MTKRHPRRQDDRGRKAAPAAEAVAQNEKHSRSPTPSPTPTRTLTFSPAEASNHSQSRQHSSKAVANTAPSSTTIPPAKITATASRRHATKHSATTTMRKNTLACAISSGLLWGGGGSTGSIAMGAMTPNRLAFVHGGLGRGVRAFSGACQAGVGRKEKGAGRVPTQMGFKIKLSSRLGSPWRISDDNTKPKTGEEEREETKNEKILSRAQRRRIQSGRGSAGSKRSTQSNRVIPISLWNGEEFSMHQGKKKAGEEQKKERNNKKAGKELLILGEGGDEETPPTTTTATATNLALDSAGSAMGSTTGDGDVDGGNSFETEVVDTPAREISPGDVSFTLAVNKEEKPSSFFLEMFPAGSIVNKVGVDSKSLPESAVKSDSGFGSGKGGGFGSVVLAQTQKRLDEKRTRVKQKKSNQSKSKKKRENKTRSKVKKSSSEGQGLAAAPPPAAPEAPVSATVASPPAAPVSEAAVPPQPSVMAPPPASAASLPATPPAVPKAPVSAAVAPPPAAPKATAPVSAAAVLPPPSVVAPPPTSAASLPATPPAAPRAPVSAAVAKPPAAPKATASAAAAPQPPSSAAYNTVNSAYPGAMSTGASDRASNKSSTSDKTSGSSSHGNGKGRAKYGSFDVRDAISPVGIKNKETTNVSSEIISNSDDGIAEQTSGPAANALLEALTSTVQSPGRIPKQSKGQHPYSLNPWLSDAAAGTRDPSKSQPPRKSLAPNPANAATKTANATNSSPDKTSTIDNSESKIYWKRRKKRVIKLREGKISIFFDPHAKHPLACITTDTARYGEALHQLSALSMSREDSAAYVEQWVLTADKYGVLPKELKALLQEEQPPESGESSGANVSPLPGVAEENANLDDISGHGEEMPKKTSASALGWRLLEVVESSYSLRQHVPRVIAVGDVHGCLAEMEDLLREVEYWPGDLLVFLGDLVSKGPDSPGVVRAARELGGVTLRGNHDFEVIQWLTGDNGLSKPNNHANIAAELSKKDGDFLEKSPWYFDCAELNSLFVHAGFAPGVPMSRQDPRVMMNMRSVQSDGSLTSKVVGSVRPWASFWPGPRTVYFGHDAFRGLQTQKHAVGLDTGCVYGGRLTACILPGKHLVSVDSRKTYIVYARPKAKGYVWKKNKRRHPRQNSRVIVQAPKKENKEVSAQASSSPPKKVPVGSSKKSATGGRRRHGQKEAGVAKTAGADMDEAH